MKWMLVWEGGTSGVRRWSPPEQNQGFLPKACRRDSDPFTLLSSAVCGHSKGTECLGYSPKQRQHLLAILVLGFPLENSKES